MSKIYISGKITGDDNFISKFKDAKTKCADRGWNIDEIVNPCELPQQETWEDYMIMGIKELFDCSHILMLPDWKESKGARIEHAIALNCNKLIIYG